MLMRNAYAGGPEQAVQTTMEQGLTDRVLALLTHDTLTLAALALFGCVIGICFMGLVRTVYPKPGAHHAKTTQARWQLNMRRAAIAAGLFWTLALELLVLVGDLWAKTVIASGLAIIAGAATGPIYNLMRTVWAKLLTALPKSISKRLGGD